MNADKLSGLKPESVFYWFEQICAVPHGSGNTRAISDFLVKFAQERELRFIQDEADNVTIFAPGTGEQADHPAVILQGHMDMVCDKEVSCSLNMALDPIDLAHDDRYVFARGTTLGGDDGIAVACILALLDDPSIPHPPIEALITSDEEVGMLGAAALDMSPLQGRMLINMDSEEEGIFTVSCAGGARVHLQKDITAKPVYGQCYRIQVSGLRGGHSGAEIHKNRANANKVMAELLAELSSLAPVSLISLNGGSKDNAIARTCSATVSIAEVKEDEILLAAQKVRQAVCGKYDEPDAVIHVTSDDALGGSGLSAEESAQIIALLNELPNGVVRYSKEMPGLVQTSLNLGVVKLGEHFSATVSVRSSVNAEKEELLEKLRDLSVSYSCSYSRSGEYPAWEYKKESQLRDTMVRVYREQYGMEPEVLAIHAGLECGLLSDKLPGLDCVSIGPNMQNVHTSQERLEIASVERTWQFLLAVLKTL